MVIKTKSTKAIITNLHSSIINFVSKEGDSIQSNWLKIRYINANLLPRHIQTKLGKHAWFNSTKYLSFENKDKIRDVTETQISVNAQKNIYAHIIPSLNPNAAVNKDWIGISYIIPKKIIKTAVERNYLKRIFREATIQSINTIPNQTCVIFIVTEKIHLPKLEDVKALLGILKRNKARE